MTASKTISLSPTEEVVQVWVASMVPSMDLFMADERLVTQLGTQASVLIIPRAEFDAHPSYRDVRVANAYTYWTIDREVPYVLHAPPRWMETLTPEMRRDVLTYQVQVGRGLVFPVSDDMFIDQSSSVVMWDDTPHLVLHRSVWQTMTDATRRRLTMTYAGAWEEWTTSPIPPTCPDHVKRLANTFPVNSGSNCLAATLFAVTGEDWIASQWVHPGTFLQTLGQADYAQVETEIRESGDVLTFVDEAGRIQHATYCIGNGLFFNKNGQTLFNPWKLIQERDLFEAWGSYTCHSYRRL
ncbi:hypothetical protein [Exiguobacterium aurantiacum]|uniref:Uncharacterized protein n=1 Tax=Exiguobacterium aurantiacum TaxID=33987 RepID=A0ABY5FL41_9BACL|nr:hypothetical protein [Exiguobacterium aurantiacum]UTT42262.1 hypothetical protein NMQ00_11935 [Exiguobacterium aurantiacum]